MNTRTENVAFLVFVVIATAVNTLAAYTTGEHAGVDATFAAVAVGVCTFIVGLWVVFSSQQGVV